MDYFILALFTVSFVFGWMCLILIKNRNTCKHLWNTIEIQTHQGIRNDYLIEMLECVRCKNRMSIEKIVFDSRISDEAQEFAKLWDFNKSKKEK